MCEICIATCQECGIQICFDIERRDDCIAPAYVTSSGDLYCSDCEVAMDRLDDESEYETYEQMEYDWREELP